ncbi:MAG TPA: hypothetical protein VGO40_23775, partial [Longimicrobium sp.]|nr:hypothetical protein [Longimicrobium sp.]
KSNIQGFIDFVKQRVEEGAIDPKLAQKIIERNQVELRTTDERVRSNYKKYLAFCDRVVRPLLDLKT